MLSEFIRAIDKAERIKAILARGLRVDPNRYVQGDGTGIFVRAQYDSGTWDSVDIAVLDFESLIAWLRSRGGANEWAERTVAVLLGHPVPECGPWSEVCDDA